MKNVPKLVNPRPAVMSLVEVGHVTCGVVALETAGDEFMGKPSNCRRASYMFAAFLSTLFTITDYNPIRNFKNTDKYVHLNCCLERTNP